MNEEINRFKAQCFLYVCNKLDPKETAWMDEMLRKHPQLQADVDEDRTLAEQSRQALVEARIQQNDPPLVSFEQIRRNLIAQQQDSFTERLAAWWRLQAATPARTGRWGLVVVLVLGVTITLTTSNLLENKTETTAYRAIEGGGVQVAVLEVVFKPEVTVGQIREQLATLNMRIINGPDRAGLYEIEVSRGTLQDGLQALRDSELVKTAQIQDLRSRDSR